MLYACFQKSTAWHSLKGTPSTDDVLQGIKIVDAASKKKAREALEAEQELRRMEVESNAGWEEAPPLDMEDME